MKKTLLLLIATLCLSMFVGCGDNFENENSESESSSSSEQTSSTSTESIYEGLYDEYLNDLKSEDGIYYIMDINNDNTDELLIMNNTTLSVYTYKNEVTKIGENDFKTGTIRLFDSEKTEYPGVFFYFVGGGKDTYGYMTIKDNELSFEELWKEQYSLPADDANRIIKITNDENAIAESKFLYNNDKDIDFVKIGNN